MFGCDDVVARGRAAGGDVDDDFPVGVAESRGSRPKGSRDLPYHHLSLWSYLDDDAGDAGEDRSRQHDDDDDAVVVQAILAVLGGLETTSGEASVSYPAIDEPSPRHHDPAHPEPCCAIDGRFLRRRQDADDASSCLHGAAPHASPRVRVDHDERDDDVHEHGAFVP